MIECLILDDRPDTCDDLMKHLREFDLDAEVTKVPKVWWQTREVYSEGQGEARPPLLVDNHLEDVPPFELDGVEINVSRDNAGFDILEKVILPRIDSGELKGVPIALISSHDIDSIREEFTGKYGDKYDNVFFFSKEKENKDGLGTEEALKYIKMAKEYLNSFQLDLESDDEAMIALLDIVREDLGLSLAEVRAAFNVKSQVSDSVYDVLRRSETQAWKQKVVKLAEMTATLRTTFEQEASFTDAAQRWLRSTLLQKGRTAMSAILSGDDNAPQQALDRAMFPFAYD